MHKKPKKPLMDPSHLPLVVLGAVLAVYGLAGALVGSWFASRAMRGLITAGTYRTQLQSYDQVAGLIAGILMLVLFILCAVKSKGIVRAAFVVGAFSSLSPMLASRADNLLFSVIGLPTMGAGSVVAGAVTTLLFALPMSILFILLACSGRVPTACRWVSLLSIFVVLVTAIYPIYVTVLAFLVRPGDPAVGRMMEVSTQVIKLRYLLPGLSFLLLAYLSARFKPSNILVEESENVIEKGATI